MTEQSQPPKEAAFFTSIRQWGLTRGEHGVVGGVVEGLGARVGMAAVPARLIVVLAWFLLSGLVMLGYAAAWGLLPDRRGNIIIQNFGRGVTNVGALLGIAVLTLFGFAGLNDRPLFSVFGWGADPWVWDGIGGGGAPEVARVFAVLMAITIPLLVISGVIVLIVWLVKRSKDTTPPAHSGSGGWVQAPAASGAETGQGEPDAGAAGEPAAPGGPGEEAANNQTSAPTPEQARASAVPPTAVHVPQPWEPALIPGDPRVAGVAPAVPTMPGATAPPTPPAPPVPYAPYQSPRPQVPGPGKGGYLAFLGVLLVSAALVIGIERADRLAVNPVLAWGAIVTVGLGVVLIAVALTGRKLGFLGFLSVLAVLAGVPLAAQAEEIRAEYNEPWGWWDIDVSVGHAPEPEPEPVISATPAGRPFDATAAFADEYAVTRIVSGCSSISESGGPTEPHELGDVQTAIRLDELSTDETIELSEGVTRLTIPEGTSVELHGTLNLTTLWPQRDLYCDFWTDSAETWLHVLSNPGDPLLTVISEEGAALYIEEQS